MRPISQRKLKRWLWIRRRVEERRMVDILDRYFSDEYIYLFNPKVDWTTFGASYVRLLAQDLAEMSKRGYLRRHRSGIEGMGCGWPKWVWSYRLGPAHEDLLKLAEVVQ